MLNEMKRYASPRADVNNLLVGGSNLVNSQASSRIKGKTVDLANQGRQIRL